MEGTSDSPIINLGSKAIDSHELRMKHRNSLLQSSNQSEQSPKSRVSEFNSSTPEKSLRVCPDPRDTTKISSTFYYSPKPNFVQSSVYPQEIGSVMNKPSSSLPQDPDSFMGANQALALHPQAPNPLPSIPSYTPDLATNPLKPKSGNTNRSSTNPARKLQTVFQREGENQACEDRISSLVLLIEDEMLTLLLHLLLQQSGSRCSSGWSSMRMEIITALQLQCTGCSPSGFSHTFLKLQIGD